MTFESSKLINFFILHSQYSSCIRTAASPSASSRCVSSPTLLQSAPTAAVKPSSHNMEGTIEKCNYLTVSSKALQGAKELSQVSTHGWQCSQGTRDGADDTGPTVPLTPTILASSQSLCITLYTTENVFESWEIPQCSRIHFLGFITTLSSPRWPLGHTQTNWLH